MNFETVFNRYKRLTFADFLGLSVLFFLIFIFLSHSLRVKFIQDDAYTSFRYAKNFTEGNGLVFNEGEKVEGYTNFLWVMLLSGEKVIHDKIFLNDNLDASGDILSFTHIEKTAQLFSLFFSVVILILTYSLGRMLNGSRGRDEKLYRQIINEIVHLTPVALMAYSIPLIYWGVSAMETSLFVSFTLLSVIRYLKNYQAGKPDYILVFISFLNSLVRPEGLLVFALIIFHKISFDYFSSIKENRPARIREAFDKTTRLEIMWYSIPLLIYIGFRIIYYGYPLPNTFYAKTEFSPEFIIRGINYFLEFAQGYLFYGAALILPVVLFKDKKNIRSVSFLLCFSVSWIIMIILIGGDVLPLYRFFLPVLPLIYLVFVKSIFGTVNYLLPNKKILALSTFAVLLASIAGLGVINYTIQKPGMIEKRSYESGLVKKMKVYAAWVKNKNLNVHKDEKAVTVAMSTIGAFSYFSGAHVIDIVGLTDSYIAHHPRETEGIGEELPVLWKERRYNAEYVLSQKPDYIIFPAGAKPSAFAECALFVHDDFRENYYTQIFYSDEMRQFLPIFTRKEKIRNNENQDCGIKYLKYYIMANNSFVKMLERGDRTLLKQIVEECDRVIQLCPQKTSEANALKGMAFYHSNNFLIAQDYLLKAIKNDETNSIAAYYLMKVYDMLGKKNEALSLIPAIVRYSPDVFPNLVIE